VDDKGKPEKIDEKVEGERIREGRRRTRTRIKSAGNHEEIRRQYLTGELSKKVWMLWRRIISKTAMYTYCNTVMSV
jgi:hypothetical protein